MRDRKYPTGIRTNRARLWLLEDHRQGQGDLPLRHARGHEENASLLHGQSSQGREDQLGHARVQAPEQVPVQTQQGT
jgi:hypothetical protein